MSSSDGRDSTRTAAAEGVLWGAIGVVVFSLTMPMTKIALSGEALSPTFIWAGRTVVAAIAGALYLLATRAAMPAREARLPLLGAAIGVVLGWPLLNTLALQTVPSSHAAVVNGILPLATAVIGAGLNRESLPGRFWYCAVFGTVLVSGYAWTRAAGRPELADGLMLAGVVLGGLGYACGAIAARYMTGPQAISWALLFALPVTLPVALWSAPPSMAKVSPQSWAAFGYLGLMSQWMGFFFWYRGLAIGGIAKVSQVQLTQLFLTLGFSALLLREHIDLSTIAIALLTVALIVVGRRKRA